MRFQKTFFRQKGTAAGANVPPVLGSDAAPTTTPPTAQQDNVMACKLRDINGWPVQRVAVCWTTLAAPTTAISANLYFWEELSQHWHLINAAPLAMNPNQLFFFDTVTISEPSPTTSGGLGQVGGNNANAGAMEVMLVASDPGAGLGNGTYQFVMGPDLTTVGT